MSNLRDRRANDAGNIQRDLLGSSLRTFDAVYDAWVQHRGLGRRGSIRGSHAQNPDWENELILGSMGHHPAAALQEPCCYNDCDLTCKNNQRVLRKLKDIMQRYLAVKLPWLETFERRVNLKAEVKF